LKPDKKCIVSQYNIEGKALESFLGPLETTVMETVWASEKPLSVRETYEALNKNKKIAYTTVMTIMDRLFEKGLLCRKTKKSRGGLSYIYWANIEKQNFQNSAVREVLKSLVASFGETVANFIIEETNLSKEDQQIIKQHFKKERKDETSK
jgi:predicted transcriptional regulator